MQHKPSSIDTNNPNPVETANSNRRFLIKPLNIVLSKLTTIPMSIIMVFAMINLGAYLINSWMMRPIGDDYVWIHEFYNSDRSWLHALYDFFLSQNGRYSQNILVAVPYAILGPAFVKLSGFISIGLLFVVCYFGLRAVESIWKIPLATISRSFKLSAIILLCTSFISVTYDFIRGDIDNSFQYILYYPGIVTYTMPVLFTLGMLAIVVTERNKEWKGRHFITLFIAAFLIGLFGETVPILYCAGLAATAAAACIYRRLKSFPLLLVRDWKYITVALGFITAILTIYFSPAGFVRRQLVAQIPNYGQATLTDIISGAVVGTQNQINYLINPENNLILGIVLVILVGIAVGIAYNKLRQLVSTKILLLLVPLSAMAWVVSIYISTFLYAYGYNTPTTVTPPRFEVLYMGWIILALISFGLLLHRLLLFVGGARRRTDQLIAASLVVVLLLLTPYFLNKQTHRVMTISNFSQAWQVQDAELKKAAEDNVRSITIPVVDIGDGFGITCKRDGHRDWLSLAKQNYYRIPEVCGVKN